MKIENVTIIGSGPAGLTCAVYTARAGLAPTVIGGSIPGGQLITTDSIENFPGFESITGTELMMKMMSQAEASGGKIRYDDVFSITRGDENFLLTLVSGEPILSRAVVIASGAKHKNLGAPGEKEFANKGVSYCATCDGPIYKGKTTAVVGGGNTAVMEALFLSMFCERVYLIHRREKLRADPIMQDKLFKSKNITCIWNSEVGDICGSDKLECIKLHDNQSDSFSVIELSGLFIAIGTRPSSEFVKNLVDLDDEGYIITNSTRTSCPGIFASGDVASGSIKQAVVAAGEGCIAAKHVSEYLGV